MIYARFTESTVAYLSEIIYVTTHTQVCWCYRVLGTETRILTHTLTETNIHIIK